MKRAVWLLAPAWAVGISFYIMFAPLIRGVSASASLSRGPVSQTAPQAFSSSWYQAFGLAAARPLAIPVLLALLPALMRSTKSRRIFGAVSILGLGGFCLLAAFSIGPYFMPSVVALAAALVIECVIERKEPKAAL